MSQSEHFKRLGAQFANQRWSWGATREDGSVVLRVWQDQMKTIDNARCMRVTFNVKYADDPDNLGHQERLRHVKMIEQGAKCYLVMCLAKDPNARPRVVKSFNKEDVFIGGKLVESAGDWWIELGTRMSIRELME